MLISACVLMTCQCDFGEGGRVGERGRRESGREGNGGRGSRRVEEGGRERGETQKEGVASIPGLSHLQFSIGCIVVKFAYCKHQNRRRERCGNNSISSLQNSEY